jgi:trimeric autotransporter adhesin
VDPSGFLYQISNGESIRHAGIIQLRRRLRHGFGADARYTFSKSIDDAALGAQGSQGGTQIAQNWLDLKAERALSSFDQRHILDIQAQYTSGSGGFRPMLLKGWAGAILKEWTFTGNMTIGSGRPLTPIYSAVVWGTGMTGSIRPNRTDASIYAAPAGLFLNPAAFSPPETGEWGNAGRNSITGPSQFNLDASLGRAFRVRDRYNIEFRLVSRNILNHVTFPSWNTMVDSSQFGLANPANPMRTFQANLRVSF